MTRRDQVPMLACGAILMVLAATMMVAWPIELVDDAYISYRYAANLVDVGELVFNAGERVEGITNLLWVLLLGLGHALTGIRIELIAVALSLGLFLASCWRTYDVAHRICGRPVVAALVVLPIALDVDVFGSATNGLEAGLYALLIAESFHRLLRQQTALLGLTTGLLFMTRPEGIAVGLLFVAMTYVATASLRRAGWALLIQAAIAVAVTGFRLYYYGSPVPNSIVAKSVPLPAMAPMLLWSAARYVAAYLAGHALLLLPALTWLLLLTGRLGRGLVDRAQRPAWPVAAGPGEIAAWGAAAILLLSVLVVVHNGGDWMPNYRLLVQYFPCYGVIAAHLWRTAVLSSAVVGAAALVPALLLADRLHEHGCCTTELRLGAVSPHYETALRKLSAVAEEGDVISVEAAGYLPYHFRGRRFHDPLGLLDAHIARYGTPVIPYGKTDLDYTLGTVRPAFLVWHFAGHLRRASSALLDGYEAFCYAECAVRDRAHLVMVRKDRLDARVRAAFADGEPWPLRPPTAPGSATE